MKKLILIIMILCVPMAYPQGYRITSFINDHSNLLTPQDKLIIEPILKDIYDKGLAEYSIVIVNSTDGEDIEGFSYKIAEGNLGDKQTNNGLLLLIAVNDRDYRFEVGRGLEPALPDIIMSRIGRNYIEPNFKDGNYAKGIEEASYAIRDRLFNNTDSQYYKSTGQPEGVNASMVIFIILVIFAIIAIAASSRSTVTEKKGKKKKTDDDFFTAAWLLSSMTRGGRGGLGGSGGFSGGGGFGGFGGGSFGGGGAGGHWNRL
jgi:uncharacterized protein